MGPPGDARGQSTGEEVTPVAEKKPAKKVGGTKKPGSGK